MPITIKKKLSCYTIILNFLSIIDDRERDEIIQKLQQTNPHS